MAKLYAEITSDKGGRVVGKGGNSQIVIRLNQDNDEVMTIIMMDVGQKKPHIIVNDWRK